MGMFSDIDYSLIVLQLEKAMANGVATLDSNTKVPKAQISLTASDVGAIASTGNEVLTSLNAASGTISSGLLPSYVDDVLSYTNLAGFPGTGETGKIYVDETTNKVYRWSGSVYVEISSSATAGEALKLTTPRTITTTGDASYSVSFDGSANVTSAITLATVNSNVGSFGSASSIPAITVNAKGQVTAVSTNSIGNELIAIQSLSDTPGFLKKIGDGTYSIDTASYLPLTGANVTGNLGIGVASPSVKLSVGRLGGAFTIPAINANTAVLLTPGGGVAASGAAMTMLGGNTSQLGLFFGDTEAGEKGGIYYSNLTDVLELRAVGSNRISISATSTAFSSTTVSTSTTTGAIVAASLGVTGAIFADTVSANSYNLIPIGRGGGNISTNTVTGVNSLLSNTTGSGLSAFGVGALVNNTTGNNSTAVGVGALLSNTTGVLSTAVGSGTLQANTTGGFSSAFGSNAGRFTSDGVTGLTISNNSCFFGANTKGTQNATNENVFGYNATGNGSNTVTIGDFNITNNFFRGALSLNATQVVSTRRTGWTAPTGTPTRTTFVTSTVTLTGLAERVKALIDDLITHGLIGA